MINQLKAALLLSCISVSSYAYFIDSTLKIENKTNTPLVIIVTQYNGEKFKQPIAANSSTTLNKEVMNNNDHSGWLYQTATQPFEIRSDDTNNTLYAQGRVMYYIHSAYWEEYSFLDSLSSATGVTLDPEYSCHKSNTTFNNKIVIDGKPEKILQPVKAYPTDVHCKGLKSSRLDYLSLYHAVCADGNEGYFQYVFGDSETDLIYALFEPRQKTKYIITTISASSLNDKDKVKKTLDDVLNNPAPSFLYCFGYPGCNSFCGSW